MDPLALAKEFWRKAVKPLFVTECRETLFGTRYNKMNEVKATLSPLEQQRLKFFIAATSEEDPIKDYIQYINRMAQFCEQCVRNPESQLAKGLDMARIAQFKTMVDLTVSAIRQSDKAYLDRVRAEMRVPQPDEDMTARVHRAEVSMLKEDIADRMPPRP